MDEPRNHGKAWLPSDIVGVANDWVAGADVPELMEKYGRTRVAVETKLKNARLLTSDPLTFKSSPSEVGLRLRARLQKGEPPTEPELDFMRAHGITVFDIQPVTDIQLENTDMTKLIETRTFLLGIDITEGNTVSDETIFKALSHAEAEVKRLESVEHKPKRLVRKIEELKADIVRLVEFLDAHD